MISIQEVLSQFSLFLDAKFFSPLAKVVGGVDGSHVGGIISGARAYYAPMCAKMYGMCNRPTFLLRQNYRVKGCVNI